MEHATRETWRALIEGPASVGGVGVVELSEGGDVDDPASSVGDVESGVVGVESESGVDGVDNEDAVDVVGVGHVRSGSRG
jgi:hypothetical protein